jgi:alanine or glycine:cation symporter, AGCS family
MNVNQLDAIGNYINRANDLIWGWPLIIFFIGVGLMATIALNFLQVRYFTAAWRLILKPSEHKRAAGADMSPFQAFINALSTSIGNGSLAGMATAIHQGGPGAAFWIFVLGFFALPIRFCEVYLSNAFPGTGNSIITGGPMAYLKHVPGRAFLPSFYAFFCLMLSFISGNAIQSNSVSNGIQTIVSSLNVYIIAACIGGFVVYVILGGAQRIVKISELIVPLKVGLFFVSALIILIYHMPSLAHALSVIVTSAFTPQAIQGALIGTTMQSAIRFGMSRSLNATEIGLGTAAVFFGSTGSKHSVENGIMSMVSAFISNYLVCFVLCLIIVLTGVWNHDVTSIALTTQAFGTVYGSAAGWLVTTLSIFFGIGVLVAYAYIGRECWSYLTSGRFLTLYSIIYCSLAFLGAVAKVQLVWDAVDIVIAGLTIINLYAILVLMPHIRQGVQAYRNSMHK